MSSQSTTSESHSLAPYHRIRQSGLRLQVLSDPPGVIDSPASRFTNLSIHVGPSVDVACRRGGYSHRGRAVHGDIDIIPAGIPSRWEIAGKDTALLLSVSPDLLAAVAEEFDLEPRRFEIRNRFQLRDPQLENIGWALKAEMVSGYPCGRLYIDSLAISVAARLISFHSSLAPEPDKVNGGLSGRRLRLVLSYIEDNLVQDISLGELARVAGISASHFKTLFRQSVGLPVHQYLIRRRLERAKSLLDESELPISQIAAETGFAHQSHLARHMRRVLGVSPKAFRETRR